jgi:hypothetical protein
VKHILSADQGNLARIGEVFEYEEVLVAKRWRASLFGSVLTETNTIIRTSEFSGIFFDKSKQLSRGNKISDVGSVVGKSAKDLILIMCEGEWTVRRSGRVFDFVTTFRTRLRVKLKTPER